MSAAPEADVHWVWSALGLLSVPLLVALNGRNSIDCDMASPSWVVPCRGVLLVAESAQHFSRVPRRWLGAY